MLDIKSNSAKKSALLKTDYDTGVIRENIYGFTDQAVKLGILGFIRISGSASQALTSFEFGLPSQYQINGRYREVVFIDGQASKPVYIEVTANNVKVDAGINSVTIQQGNFITAMIPVTFVNY